MNSPGTAGGQTTTGGSEGNARPPSPGLLSAAVDVESGPGWRMYLGDCRRVLPHLDEVDHVITDPPFEAESHTKLRRSGSGSSRGGRRVSRAAPLSFPPMTEPDRREVAAHFNRLTKRWCLVFAQLEGVPRWRSALERARHLRHMRTCVWVKPDACPQFTGDRPGTGYEMLECAHVHGRARWNGGGRRGFFVHPAWTQNRTSADHETKKPLPLMLELVELFTDPGEEILDAYAGEGSTGVAALKRGRRFVGIEQNERWWRKACEALRAAEQGQSVEAMRAKQVRLFPNGEAR